MLRIKVKAWKERGFGKVIKAGAVEVRPLLTQQLVVIRQRPLLRVKETARQVVTDIVVVTQPLVQLDLWLWEFQWNVAEQVEEAEEP